MSKLLKYLWSFVPCLHEYKKVHTDMLGAYQTRHHLECTKCGSTATCDCAVCREPWRDW